MNVRKILFLQRQPAGPAAREALDAILVAGVFEQAVSVLFKDDGVWQIARNPAAMDGEMAEAIESLADYDITALYACRDSLASRTLTEEDLLVPIRALSIGEQAVLIGEQDAVVND